MKFLCSGRTRGKRGNQGRTLTTKTNVWGGSRNRPGGEKQGFLIRDGVKERIQGRLLEGERGSNR